MRSALTILTAAAIVLLAAGAQGQLTYGGVITIGSVEVPAGESVSVPITLSNNDIGVCAILLPIKYSSPSLTLDSVSLTGTVWNEDFECSIGVDPATRTAQILISPWTLSNPLPDVDFEDGVIAYLYVTAASDATAQLVTVDSVYKSVAIGGGVYLETKAQVSDNDANLYYPDFVAGTVNVKVPTGINDFASGTLPADYELAQNYPNPFNPTTVIAFGLPTAGHVKLAIFNILGQQVRVLLDGNLEAGEHQVDFNAESLPSGIYFYRLSHEGGALTRKMMLVK